MLHDKTYNKIKYKKEYEYRKSRYKNISNEP